MALVEASPPSAFYLSVRSGYSGVDGGSILALPDKPAADVLRILIRAASQFTAIGDVDESPISGSLCSLSATSL